MEYIKYPKGNERVREAALALLDWIGMCGQLNEDEIELRDICLKFIRKGEDNVSELSRKNEQYFESKGRAS